MRIRIRIQLKIFPGSRSRSGGGGGGCRSAKNVHPPWPNPRYAPGLRTVQQSSPPPSPLQDVAVNLLSLQLARRPYPHGPHPGFGSGSWSELDPDSIGSVDPDPEKRERGTEGGWVGLGGREWGGGGGWEWKTLKTDICMEIKKDQYSRILDNGHIYSTVVFFVGSLGVNVMYYEFLFMVMNSEYCRYRQASNPIILVRSLPHNYNVWIIKQGCQSGSWFNRVSGSGSGSKRAKRPTKVELFKVPIWSFGWPIWELKATSVTLTYGYGLQLQSAGSFHRSTGHNITMINYQRSVDPDPGRQKEPTKM